MALTQEEIRDVASTGMCHQILLTWSRFMDGTGAEVPVSKARAVCSVCQTEFIKEVRVINLNEIDS